VVAEVERKKRAGHVKVLAHFYQSTDPRRGSGIMAELLGARSETEASKSDGIIRILGGGGGRVSDFLCKRLLPVSAGRPVRER
jgi:hypothetical protein